MTGMPAFLALAMRGVPSALFVHKMTSHLPASSAASMEPSDPKYPTSADFERASAWKKNSYLVATVCPGR